MLTAVHIINRLPHVALNFEVPYEKLFKEPVDYEHLKIFGCLAMAYNSSHGTDKFAPRGIACCFIGYPIGTKGYRLLNLTTMQPFVSRHVVFHDDVFPLNKNTEKPYVTPLLTKVPFTNKVVCEDEFADYMVEDI